MKKKKESLRPVFSNIIFCLHFLFKLNKKLYFVRIPLVLLDSILTFIPIIFVRLILNEITVGKSLARVMTYVLIMVIVNFSINLIKSFISKYDAIQLEKTMYEIKLALGKSVMKMKYSELETPRVKNFISIANKGNCFFDVLTCSTGVVFTFINLLGFTAIILTIQPLILILIISVIALKMFIDKKSRNFQFFWNHETATIQRKLNYLMETTIDIRLGKEIRINKIENWIYNKILKHFNEEMFPAERNLMKRVLSLNSLIEISAIIQQALIYFYLAYRVVFRGMLVGDFSMYLTSIESFSDSVSGFLGNISSLINNGLFVQDFRYCMESTYDYEDNIAAVNELIDFDKNNFVIEFKNVSFKYPNTENLVLKNISIELSSAESLSIVGLNGAGKTTFVKLLCRLYAPTSGEILLNGIPINTIKYDIYTKLLGVVFQDFKLFSFSIKENITLDMVADQTKLEKCIKESGLQDKIYSLPQKTETMLYKEFDSNGIEFSGGEGQKLAIARTLYKGSPILILDEPTSALDPIAEYEVYKSFSNISLGKCTIYISHRLSSTRFTDKIVVFSEGRIVEYGTHIELMDINEGIYRNMFSIQKKYYE